MPSLDLADRDEASRCERVKEKCDVRVTLSPVPTRKEWRNREPSAGEGVLALLEALREGLGAQGVGLFDDDRADPAHQPPNFWDAFDQRPCAEIDWGTWYRQLRYTGRVETTCGCGGGHHLLGFLMRERWALLIVAPPSLEASVAAAIASSVRALSAQLPPAKKIDPQRPPVPETDDDRRPPGSAPGLLWWVRKGPQ
jgi:hypothetical protein